jgi:hypothetical protein
MPLTRAGMAFSSSAPRYKDCMVRDVKKEKKMQLSYLKSNGVQIHAHSGTGVLLGIGESR